MLASPSSGINAGFASSEVNTGLVLSGVITDFASSEVNTGLVPSGVITDFAPSGVVIGFAPSEAKTGLSPSGINAGVVQKNPPQGGRFLVFAKAKASVLGVVPASSHGQTVRSQYLSRLAAFLSNVKPRGQFVSTLRLFFIISTRQIPHHKFVEAVPMWQCIRTK